MLRETQYLLKCTYKVIQLSQFTNPTMHLSHIPQCTNFVAEMCTFLLQNGCIVGYFFMHCGICEMGLFSLTIHVIWSIITMRPKQNGCHFADGTLKCFFLKVKFSISNEISLKYDFRDMIGDKPILIAVMAWCYQITSHHLNQCWPTSVMPYCITRLQLLSIINQIAQHYWENRVV